MVIETAYPDDRFFLFAELNGAFNELRDRAAKTRILLAMIDDDAHAAAPNALYPIHRQPPVAVKRNWFRWVG